MFHRGVHLPPICGNLCLFLSTVVNPIHKPVKIGNAIFNGFKEYFRTFACVSSVCVSPAWHLPFSPLNHVFTNKKNIYFLERPCWICTVSLVKFKHMLSHNIPYYGWMTLEEIVVDIFKVFSNILPLGKWLGCGGILLWRLHLCWIWELWRVCPLQRKLRIFSLLKLHF